MPAGVDVITFLESVLHKSYCVSVRGGGDANPEPVGGIAS